MRSYEYDITYHKSADPDSFEKLCRLLEHGLPQFRLSKDLMDVDGSQIRVYQNGFKEYKVYNDYDVGAVYVKSDVDVAPYIRPSLLAE